MTTTNTKPAPTGGDNLPSYVLDQLTEAERSFVDERRSGRSRPFLELTETAMLVWQRLAWSCEEPVAREELLALLSRAGSDADPEAVLDEVAAELDDRGTIHGRDGDPVLTDADVLVSGTCGVLIIWQFRTVFLGPDSGLPTGRHELPLKPMLLLAALAAAGGRFRSVPQLMRAAGLRRDQVPDCVKQVRALLGASLVVDRGSKGYRLDITRSDLADGTGSAALAAGRKLAIDDALDGIWIDGRFVDLPPNEAAMLARLAKDVGSLVPAADIAEAVWQNRRKEQQVSLLVSHLLSRGLGLILMIDGSGYGLLGEGHSDHATLG